MKSVCCECYETGEIREVEMEYPSRFLPRCKYEVWYAEELPRFRKDPLNIYALPYFDKPRKLYSGVGRPGLNVFDEHKSDLTKEQNLLADLIETGLGDDGTDVVETLMRRENTALEYVALFEQADDIELIWVRNSGVADTPPEGYVFIGYDVAYPGVYYGSFSMICDCMFICQWHGCDAEGTLFLPDFHRLNDHGLFSVWQDAYDYMVKYLREEWTERGVYCIFEVYCKR